MPRHLQKVRSDRPHNRDHFPFIYIYYSYIMQSYDDTTNSEIYYSFIHLKSNYRIAKYFWVDFF